MKQNQNANDGQNMDNVKMSCIFPFVAIYFFKHNAMSICNFVV